MAEADRWDRFKDFVYRHMPERVRRELDIMAATYRIDTKMAESARRDDQPTVGGPLPPREDTALAVSLDAPTTGIPRYKAPDYSPPASRGEAAAALEEAAMERSLASRYEPGSDGREQFADRARNLLDHARNLREGYQIPDYQQESMAQYRKDNDAGVSLGDAWDSHGKRVDTHVAEQHVREYLTERGIGFGDLPGKQLDEYIARTNPKLYDEVLAVTGREQRPPSWGEEYQKGTGMGRDAEILHLYTAAIRKPGAVEIPPPPLKPTESRDYVETERYHDKHHRPVSVERPAPGDSRQQGLGLER